MAGAVEIQGSSFRAHMQRRGEDGRKEHIRGPHRGEKRKAEQDLERLRAAAEEASDAAWSAMAAESRRLQERADFEARVSVCASALVVRPPSPCSEESDAPDIEDPEPHDSQEYYDDVDELWQDIDETGVCPIIINRFRSFRCLIQKMRWRRPRCSASFALCGILWRT